VWKQLNREASASRAAHRAFDERTRLSGVQKGRRYKVTTIGDDALQRPSDLVDRHFVRRP